MRDIYKQEKEEDLLPLWDWVRVVSIARDSARYHPPIQGFRG